MSTSIANPKDIFEAMRWGLSASSVADLGQRLHAFWLRYRYLQNQSMKELFVLSAKFLSPLVKSDMLPVPTNLEGAERQCFEWSFARLDVRRSRKNRR